MKRIIFIIISLVLLSGCWQAWKCGLQKSLVTITSEAIIYEMKCKKPTEVYKHVELAYSKSGLCDKDQFEDKSALRGACRIVVPIAANYLKGSKVLEEGECDIQVVDDWSTELMKSCDNLKKEHM